MNSNRWWYKAKNHMERVLDDLWIGALLVMSSLVVIGVFAVVLTGLYVLLRLLLGLL